MLLRFYSSIPLVVLLMTTFSVSGCQPMKTNGQPVDLSKPISEATEDASVPVTPLAKEDSSIVVRLENRIRILENQMKDAQPKLQKVDAIENSFKSLSLQLDRIATTYDVPMETPPLVAKPLASAEKQIVPKPITQKAEIKLVAKPVVRKVSVPAPVTLPSTGDLAVTSVRIGEQSKSITRIVLDTTKPAEIRYDLDNTEGLLVIDVPNAKWSATNSRAVGKSGMVKSFRASSDDDGSRLILDLKGNAKVVATARLSPSGASGNRVYVDIAPLR